MKGMEVFREHEITHKDKVSLTPGGSLMWQKGLALESDRVAVYGLLRLGTVAEMHRLRLLTSRISQHRSVNWSTHPKKCGFSLTSLYFSFPVQKTEMTLAPPYELVVRIKYINTESACTQSKAWHRPCTVQLKCDGGHGDGGHGGGGQGDDGHAGGGHGDGGHAGAGHGDDGHGGGGHGDGGNDDGRKGEEEQLQ